MEVEVDKRKRAEERCVELELEIVKWKSEYEALEAKIRGLEYKNLAMEEEIRALKRGSDEKGNGNGGGDEKRKLGNGVEVSVDLDEDNGEEDGVFLLMLENKALECEKKNAESEVEAWRRIFKELDTNLVLKDGEFPLQLSGNFLEASGRTEVNERMKLEDALKGGVGMGNSRSKDIDVNVIDHSSTYQSPGKGFCHLQAADTPPNVTLNERRDGTKERKRSDMESGCVSQARKQLEFKEDRSPCKKIAPLTPGGNRPMSLSVFDISDSDDELTIAHNQKVLPTDNQGSRKSFISSASVRGTLASESFLKKSNPDNNGQENVDAHNEELLAFSTPKRKRASNVVTNDSESSDDIIPISTVKRRQLQGRKHDQVESDVNDSLETATAFAVDDVVCVIANKFHNTLILS